jgi:hypothetical protein
MEGTVITGMVGAEIVTIEIVRTDARGIQEVYGKISDMGATQVRQA